MEWTITAPVLSEEKNYRFHPITNGHHEAIIKYCMSKDDSGLIMYMQHMLQSLCIDDKLIIENIPVIDQLFLLIRLRSICIGPRVDVIVEGETNIKHKVSLVEIQKSINKFYKQPVTLEFKDDDIKIELHYPCTWVTNDLCDYVKSVSISNNVITRETLSSEQIQQLLDELPRSHSNQITTSIDMFNTSIQSMIITKLPEPADDITLSYDQFSHIIRLIYSDSLNNFIELMYVLVKIVNMSLSDIRLLTPADTQLYYQMFVKETNEREKAQNALNNGQNSRDTRTVPGP